MSSITTAVAADYRLQQWVQLVKVWIYTTLKLDLSNFDTSNVFYHMNLHYSQTGRKGTNWWIVFFYHMSLHYSQTIVCIFCLLCWFFYHMNLHDSQTNDWMLINWIRFFYHMNLHYSQTVIFVQRLFWLFFYHMNLHYSQTRIY